MNDKGLFEKHGFRSSFYGEILMNKSRFLSAISERDKERVCEKCKYMDRVIFLCQNDYILNNSNTVIEFMNVKQTKNFGCNQFEARAK